MPGDDSTPDDTSMPNGRTVRDRVGDVVRRQTAGEQHAAGACANRGRRDPSRRLRRCRRAARDRARRPAASTRAGQPGVRRRASTARLTALITGRSIGAANAGVFVAVQLHRAQPDQRRDAVHDRWPADSRTRRRSSTNGGSARDDRARPVRVDEPRTARPEDEAERSRRRARPPPAASSSRVMPQILTIIRASLDAAARCGQRHRLARSAARERRARIRVGHEPLADQKRAVPERRQPRAGRPPSSGRSR